MEEGCGYQDFPTHTRVGGGRGGGGWGGVRPRDRETGDRGRKKGRGQKEERGCGDTKV